MATKDYSKVPEGVKPEAVEKDLSAEEAAALAYQRSNASLEDYDPRKVDDDKKAIDPRNVAASENPSPQEPVQVRADGLRPPRGDGKRLTE